MFQVRIHGRGGQGVVTAAEMLSIAAFREGRHAQAFPSFGSERMGAPVVAFCRLDNKAIRLREPVMKPDTVIIQDPTLLHQVDLFGGLVKDGYVLINTGKPLEALGLAEIARGWRLQRVATVNATELALRLVGRPVPNAALLGAFAALTKQVSLASVAAAIAETFSEKLARGNIAAASEAYALVNATVQEDAHAEAD